MLQAMGSLLRIALCGVFFLMTFGSLICLIDVVPVAWGEISTSCYGPVDARIIESRLESPPAGATWRGHLVPVIRYRYSVGGQEYESSTIHCNDRISYSPRSASGYIKKWPVGTVVTAYIASWNPQLSCLKPGTATAGFGLFGMFLLVGVIGAVGLRKSLPRQVGPIQRNIDSGSLREPITVRYKFTLQQLRTMARAHIWQSMYWLKSMAAVLVVTNLVTLRQGFQGLANTFLPVLPVILLAPLLHLWSTKSHFDSRSDRDEEIELVLDCDGVKSSSKLGSSTSSWNAVTGIVETKHGFLIYFNSAIYQWLPKAAFETSEAESRLREFAKLWKR